MKNQTLMSEDLIEVSFVEFVETSKEWFQKPKEIKYHCTPPEAVLAATQALDLEEVKRNIASGKIPATVGDQLIYLNVCECPQGDLYFEVGYATGWDDDRGVVGYMVGISYPQKWYPAELIKPLPPMTKRVYSETHKIPTMH